MPARLTVHFAERPARGHLLLEDRTYVVGRDASCDVSIDDDRISRRHAQIAAAADGWTLSDLASKNGSLADGVAVVGDAAVPLGEESWISLGGLLLHFERQSAADAQAESESRRHWRRLHGQSAATFAGSVPEILSRLLASTLEMTGAERGFVVLEGPDGSLAVQAAAGIDPEALGGAEFQGSVGAVEEALRRGLPVAASDVSAEPSLARRESVAQRGIRALVAVPLRFGEHVAGALYADSRRPGSAFTELDVEILEGLGAQVTVALAAGRLERELRDLARRVAADASLPPNERARLAVEIERAAASAGLRPMDGSRSAGETPGERITAWRDVTARHRPAEATP